uniref:Probable serine/threonine-protein kinase DDB_G0282963 isoform X1 n=2 Tax=Dermatophagoides pteronyssinus TaxID=6956 RepID=A0A6P6YDN7_DERPT|nr:probable serine/threonine-protein kinase DDB_G0282963 isoform X1 [Dermatophagoides pteronyssinus]
MIMLSDATHTNSNSTNNNFLQQHNIYRYYSQRQENDLKTLLSRYPSLRLPPPPPEFADDFDPGITEVSTVSGSSVDIPCNTTWIEDEVSLVLWFRGDTGVPIYRVDARNVPLSKAIHTISDESRKRLYFDMKQQPPVLRIKPVMASDAAEYRCRVDFRQSRTQNVIVLLNVTVPPKELLIMDVEGQKLEGVIGPYDEGSNVILICEAEGGKPSPSVNWYQANRLIDSTYTIGPHGLVRNELNIRNLNRSDFMSILTCRASNNNVTEPISATVILDMNLRPIDVKILPKSYLKSKLSSSSSHTGSITSSTIMIDPRLSFILPAGSKAEFQCQSTGSRPAAQISWWLGNERLSSNVRDSVNEDGNATVSTIVFVPSVDDNGKLLTCRADNLPMPHTALKDERLLNVQFAPQLRISFGTNIQTDSIREGSDVYMECRVKANPPVKEVVWLHEDRPIHSLMSGDPNMMPDDSTLPSLSSTSASLGSTVIMTNQSLVIQKVHRSHRGRYQCVAFNEQGETISDPLYLKVNFAPSCKPGQKLQYGVSRNEQIRIRCEVDAEPSNDLTFRWTLNTSGNGETSVEWASFTVNATTSIATYRPESSLDYGTLSCLAQNSIGIQNKPCIYSVVPAGRPDAVRGCAITNHSMSTLLVECIPGDDGGLKQHFNLEVYIGSSSSSSNIGNSINTINANNQIVDQTLAVQSASIATTTATKTNSINSNSLLQHPQRLHSNHSSSQPNFIVSSLTPGTPYTLVLYATNAKGRSHSVSLSAVTLSAPEKHTARGSFEQIVVHPILGILIGIVATIVIAVIILIILIRSRIGSNNNNSDGSRDTGINNCRDNNGHNNNHNDNNHRKRRNKQQQQQQSSLQSTTTTTACTRRSLNGTNSTMMIANDDDDDDDNNMDRSIDQSANDALLTIGSTTTSPIITSNGDLKLKRIKHQQTSSSSSSKLPHESKESKNNIILFRKKSPSKNQQKQYKNNNNKNNDNQKQFGNISANDSIADTANHNDVDVDVDKDIDLGNLNEHEKVCLVGNNDMIDTNIQDQCHQMPLHYPICSSEEPLLSTINSNTNNHLMTTTIASSNNNDNNLQNNSSEIIMQSKNVHHSFNPNCDIGHLQQQSSSQKGVGGSVITNINTNATIDNNRTPYDTSLSRGTKGSFNHRTSIITPSGPYIHHTNNTGNISATQLLDLSSTASSTGLSSSSTSSLSPNQISNTKSIPISAIGIIGQPQSQLPPLPHHQILYSHSSPSNGSPNHHHLNSPYDINGSDSVAALAAAQYSQYHPYMNTAQYISPHHHQHYVDPNNISCLYTTTSSSSTNSPSYHQQMYETGESTLFVDSYETAPSGQFMTDFTAQHQPHHHLQQQQHHHTHQQPILYYNPNDEITVNETMVNNNYSNNNSPNNKKTLSTTSSKRCNVTLLQSATSPTTPSSSLATTDLPSIDATNNSSSLYVTTIDQKLTKNNSNTVMKNLSNCDPQQQQQLYHPRQSSNSSSRYSSNNNNINNNNNNSEQTQSSSSSSSHEKICLINKRNGTAV